jgi:hypothetical protein
VAFLTDDDIGDAIATGFGKDRTALYAENSAWATRAANGNTTAKNELTGNAVALGYTAAQLEAWDYVQDFQRDIARYWALTGAEALATVDSPLLKALNRLPEAVAMMEGGLMIGGILTQPGPDPNRAGAGRSGQIDLSRSSFGDLDKIRW